MIYDSNLICHYCNEQVLLIYKNKKETNQWSLERLDNNLGHYQIKLLHCLFKCNLQRRRTNHEYFKFSKTFL